MKRTFSFATTMTMALACLLLSTSGCKKDEPVVAVTAATATTPAAPKGVPMQTTPATAGALHFAAPQDAVSETPSSQMRAGQWRIPKREGDTEDASLIVFFFGAGQGGSAAQNVQRWCAQFTDEKGAPVCQQSEPKAEQVNGLNVTRVVYKGRYQAQDMLSGQPIDKPGQELLAAVVESPSGNFFVKLQGSQKTVSAYEAYFDGQLVPSLSVK
jgi:hypothetical protein